MVVSMDLSPIIEDEAECRNGEEQYTGIATASAAVGMNCMDSIRASSDAPASEADTTERNHCSIKEDNMEMVKSLSGGNNDLFGQHIKDLIGLQLDLIEYQQIKIVNKDKQILMLKSEKEQLEARICRMERRIALQKRQYDPEESPLTKAKISIQSKNSGAKLEPQKYEQFLPVTISSRANKDLKFNSYLRTNCNYLDLAGSKLLPNVDELERKQKLKDKQSKTEYVSVPSWKTVDRTSSVSAVKETVEEEITNEAFRKRHTKPELEEKRRKRWDWQHQRQQHQQEMLSRKSEDSKTQTKRTSNDHHFVSLYPKAENAMAIEISNTVPVCVFGYPVPALTTRELELPWFNIAKREIQLRQAKEKSMKKLSMKLSLKKKQARMRSCR